MSIKEIKDEISLLSIKWSLPASLGSYNDDARKSFKERIKILKRKLKLSKI